MSDKQALLILRADYFTMEISRIKSLYKLRNIYEDVEGIYYSCKDPDEDFEGMYNIEILEILATRCNKKYRV